MRTTQQCRSTVELKSKSQDKKNARKLTLDSTLKYAHIVSNLVTIIVWQTVHIWEMYQISCKSI